jgi:hypothetical protein
MASIRRLLLTFLFSLSLVSLCAQMPLPSLSTPALERERREALIKTLNERGVPFEERSLFSAGGFGSSVYVKFHPPEASDAWLVLAIPFAGSGAESGGLPFNVETGLAFIEAVRDDSGGINNNILVAFLGNETAKLPVEQRRPHLGLEDLYTTLDSPETTALLYLDMETAPEQLLIHHGAAYTITARNVLEGLNTLCKDRLPYTLAVRFNELYKLGLVDGPDVITSAAEQGINALYLEAGQAPQVTGVDIDAVSLANVLAAYTSSLRLMTENLDRHFLIFDFFGNIVIVSEAMAVAFFILIMGLFLFILLVYTIVYHKRFLLQCAIFIRRIWVPPLFASIMILCLEVAGSFITLASNFFAIDPRVVDYGRAGFKVLIALLLFSLFLPLQQALKIPRKAAFYGNTAILLVTLGVFIAAFLDITFIPLFLSVFLLTVLGGCISIPFLTYLCGFSLPLVCLRLFENMLARNGTELACFILSEDILPTLYLVIVILPFMFILERASTLVEYRRGQ